MGIIENKLIAVQQICSDDAREAGIGKNASGVSRREGIYKDEGVVKDRVVLCSVCDTACWPELS
jgi:hypothetical protein